MKKLVGLGFAAALGAAITVVLLQQYHAQTSSPSADEPTGDVAQNQPAEAFVPREQALTAHALLAEYAADVVAAELKYPKGKQITVSGIVQKADRQPEGNTVVDIGVRMEQSTLPPGNISCITLDPNLVAPSKGKIITVVGTKYSAQVWEHPIHGTHAYIVLGPCTIKGIP